MTSHENLLGGPAPTYLPENDAAREKLVDGGVPAVEVAAEFPAYSLAWAELAERAFAEGRVVESYAYARTGYHRGLDLLRRNGWKGHGPVPWEHTANRGFLRSLAALARAAGAVDEAEEATRCRDLLKDSSAEAAAELL